MVILYADDDEDERGLFADVIRRINPDIKLIEAEDGYDAIHILSNAQMDLPDIVFLDINMPLLDGYETLIQLKKDRRLNKTKFVLYSNGITPKDPTRLSNLEVSYLKKASTLSDSVEQLRRLLENK